MPFKTGTKYDKPRLENQPIVKSVAGDFVSIVDGITFGIQNGFRFHSAVRDWKQEAVERWAIANAIFFETLAKNLRAFAAGEDMRKEESK